MQVLAIGVDRTGDETSPSPRAPARAVLRRESASRPASDFVIFPSSDWWASTGPWSDRRSDWFEHQILMLTLRRSAWMRCFAPIEKLLQPVRPSRPNLQVWAGDGRVRWRSPGPYRGSSAPRTCPCSTGTAKSSPSGDEDDPSSFEVPAPHERLTRADRLVPRSRAQRTSLVRSLKSLAVSSKLRFDARGQARPPGRFPPALGGPSGARPPELSTLVLHPFFPARLPFSKSGGGFFLNGRPRTCCTGSRRPGIDPGSRGPADPGSSRGSPPCPYGEHAAEGCAHRVQVAQVRLGARQALRCGSARIRGPPIGP